MAQVKFYAVGPSDTKSDENGIYFVTGGELYKGSSRFGLGRVWVDAEFVPSTSSKEGQARGDVVVTGSGAGWVFDGTNWQSIGGDISSLQSMWQADISTWTAGLAAGGEGSYITGITQAADGKVTASASDFALDVKTAIGGGSASGSGNGITVSVVTTSGSVTGVQVAATDLSVTSISAASGTFTNLNVTDTATFSATTVSADTLTIGGSTVEQLADKQIAAIAESYAVGTSNGISVSVTTQGGSVTGVAVNAGTFGNVMHFVDVVSSTADVASPVAGDIVVIGATASEGAVSGQEYIYTNASTWELIGDQNSYALNAYDHGTEVVTGAATTLPAAVHAIATGFDTLKSKVDAYVGGTSESANKGVDITVVVDSTTMAPSVTTSVTAASTMAFGAAGSADELATTAAVKSYFENNLVWLDASGAAL